MYIYTECLRFSTQFHCKVIVLISINIYIYVKTLASTMMENRPKLLINRNNLLSEKSPPPSKLLLNHGKPNFTIVKSSKIISPPPTEESIFSGTDLKPSALKRRSPPKVIHSNGSVNGSTNGSASSDEFLRLHKKIGGKNFDEIDNNNVINCPSMNGNPSVAVAKESPHADQHFATLQRNCILTLKHPSETNGFTNKSDIDNQMNGTALKSPTPEKPSTPEKPDFLKQSTPSPVSRSPPPLSKQNSPFNQSMESVTSPSAVNFEQRTVVSFSRDLSVTPNRYPDTVKTTKTVDANGGISSLPKEFASLKFEIAPDGELIRPVKKNAA
ncbi:uncharacterized protein LOC119655091 isoform X1 [Hermetia illucens]|uniref:uncharacterized protein LOC119655091 isoform X1 n=2 Tax=Hermetia illucens TaxID=343691 RepID=UPI0018CC4699|nr:uncharacterized protein LOC119655091 isoform X1 [Hermetia illucens]